MDQKIPAETGKKPYEKPVINKVELVPEEAVLVACKNGVQNTCEPYAPCNELPGS